MESVGLLVTIGLLLIMIAMMGWAGRARTDDDGIMSGGSCISMRVSMFLVFSI
jgi:hypothetical protein